MEGSRLAQFKVQEAFDGTAVTLGANHASVEIALAQTSNQHGDTSVLTDPLASNEEIDEVIDDLKKQLEKLRPAAKQKLKAYVEEKIRSRS
jgi:hypothetical protein